MRARLSSGYSTQPHVASPSLSDLQSHACDTAIRRFAMGAFNLRVGQGAEMEQNPYQAVVIDETMR